MKEGRLGGREEGRKKRRKKGERNSGKDGEKQEEGVRGGGWIHTKIPSFRAIPYFSVQNQT